jgi:glycosyltransferase involved in cell wall biosynthesis
MDAEFEVTELQAALARLAAENARLQRAAAQAAASASVQALRAGAQGYELHALRKQMRIMRGSLLWRLTLPVRIAVDLVRGAPPTGSVEAVRLRLVLSVLRRQGVRAASHHVLSAYRKRVRTRAHMVRTRPVPAETSRLDAAAGTLPPPNTVLAPSVLIVAELTIPQCAKYRVWQKQAYFARLGVPCTVVDWRFEEDCLSAAPLATFAILYRVPALAPVKRLIETLHKLRVPTAWEVDDLIFDAAQYLQNRNLATLDPALRESVLSGVELYRDAMLACGRGIASTEHLAAAMRAAGLADVSVVENALDEQTLALADSIRAARRVHDGVVIGYGSGTKTHDADFAEAAPALLRLLAARPEVRLRVIGELNLPEQFGAFGSRVEHLPPAHFARFLTQLGECDISIAPLEPTLFNDAKSNIKFLEAATLGLPSVSSPAANFAALVRDGETGMLAANADAWFSALDRLAGDAGLRARMGAAARRAVLDRYAPEAVARGQVAPLLAVMPDARTTGKLRVLMANVFYAPRSYGGATLVVEELARRLHARTDTEVHIVASLPQEADPHCIVRREQDGIAVFELPVDGDMVGEFDDPLTGRAFGQVLDAVRPDVVHLHSVQGLSASLATACLARDIRYVITLHDAWWVCARQFMVRADGTNCHQAAIDLRVCQDCVPGARHLQQRQVLLRAALDGAAGLISPSEAHKALYVANGIQAERIRVMPNGVRLPPGKLTRTPARHLRFGYVGGDAEVKGFSIVRRAFEALERNDWELVLVDNTLNLGYSSVDASGWRVGGVVRTVPAYTQATMDAFFTGVDVLLFPSQWKESFGLTVREALARDVWVIATEGGGPADAIVEGVNGNLIALDGRHEALTRAIAALLDRPGGLADFVNPYREQIGDFDQQATELVAYLSRLALS